MNQTATATLRDLPRRKGDETVFVSANGKPVKKDWVTYEGLNIYLMKPILRLTPGFQLMEAK